MSFILRLLKCLQSVAATRSFLAASRKLGIAQPALSRKTVELESQADQRLFDRSGEDVTLTAAEDRFLRHIRLILQKVKRAKRDMEMACTDDYVEVDFVVPRTLGLAVAAPLVKAVATGFPNIQVRCHRAH